MRQTAIYCRMADSDKQDFAEAAIRMQKESLIQLAALKGWEVKACYLDLDFSGTDLELPSLQKLIGAIRQKEIDSVLVTGFDRLAEPLGILPKGLGVEVYSASEEASVRI